MKFQKVKNNYFIIVYDDWLLVIDNIIDLFDYHKNFLESQIPNAWDNLYKVQQHKAHLNSNLSILINFEAEHYNNKKSFIELTGVVSEKIFQTKKEAIDKYGKIYISKIGGFFPHSKDIEVLDEFESNSVIFPNYSEEDIRVKQWENGTHWYAYVGDFQVITEKDVRKWDSKLEALKEAKYYLYKIRNESFKIKK